jgi:peptidoglycan/LPS O-acetylase OafA/YrhL
MQRITFLDGLRGLACVQVVIFHYFGFFAPYQAGMLSFLANGPNAVFLFFLISGFVLTNSFQGSPQRPFRLAGQRLLRLAIPALVSVVIATLLVGASMSYAAHAAQMAGWPVSRTPPMASLWADASGISIIFGYRDFGLLSWSWLPIHAGSVNQPLWTLSIELWGSLWVLLLVMLLRQSIWLYAAALLGGFYFMGANDLSLFSLGHLCAVALQNQTIRVTIERPGSRAAGLCLLAIGLLLNLTSTLAGPGILAPLLPLQGWAGQDGGTLRVELGAVLIFISVVIVPVLQSTLGRRPMQYLGRLSFSIYLIHYPVMVSAGSLVFLSALSLGHLAAAAIAFCTGLALTIGLASWFEQYIDAPAIRVSRNLNVVKKNPAVSSI